MKNNTIIQLEVTVELPMLPNFIKTSNGGTERHIPVEAMTDGDLKKIGEDWTRALILHAQARRKQ